MRRLAIGDVHGCPKTLRALVEDQIEYSKEDQLYFLGDLVNKGPDSKGVLDYVIELKKKGHNVSCIRGNHDQMFLDAYYGRIADYWATEHAEPKTLKSFGVTDIAKVPVHYFDFIKDMVFFLELDNFFLVHAGFNFLIEDPLRDFKSMLHIRKFVLKADKLGGKKLIHGHVPTPVNEIEKSVKTSAPDINIDGGCVYYLNENLGELIALDLDQMITYKQANIDQPYPIDIKK